MSVEVNGQLEVTRTPTIEELIQQRDEFESMCHEEVDLSNKFYLEWQESKKQVEKIYNRSLIQRIFNVRV